MFVIPCLYFCIPAFSLLGGGGISPLNYWLSSKFKVIAHAHTIRNYGILIYCYMRVARTEQCPATFKKKRTASPLLKYGKFCLRNNEFTYYDLMKDVCNGRQGVVPIGKVA